MKQEIIVEISYAVIFFALTVLCCVLAYVCRNQVGAVAALMFLAGALAAFTFAGIWATLCKLGITHGC